MITVLLSAFNESSNESFWKTIELVHELKLKGISIDLHVGVTVGNDDTIERLTSFGVKTKVIETQKRSERYNLVLNDCSGSDNDWVVLNHPRSLLQKEALLSILNLSKIVQWGAFTHQFDTYHPLLSFTSWWSNNVRGDIKNIFYLDHCIFVRKGLLLKIGGVPNLEIFEDTVLSQRLAKISIPVRLPYKSTTSAIRFQKNGLWTQSLRNQVLKIRFMLGGSDTGMNQSYEKDINLNR